jgi:hypothetical protein
MGPDADESFLHDLFGKIPAPDDPFRYGDKAAGFPIEYCPQGGAVTFGAGIECHVEIIRPSAPQHQETSPIANREGDRLSNSILAGEAIGCRPQIFFEVLHPNASPPVSSSMEALRAEGPMTSEWINPREKDMTKISFALIASFALASTAGTAFAAPVLGLTGDKTLVMFDTAKPAVTKKMDVTGVDKLVGIDFRPGNKTVIGVTPDFRIVSINLETGAATDVAKMDKTLTMTQAPVVVDFNPMADRLRFMTGTTNHRVHPDTGAVTVDGVLAYEEGDMHKGETPNIVSAAYTNSIGKPEKTAMYNIDATIGALIQQTKPNDGTLKAIGKLGLKDKPATYALDIQGMEGGKNTAYLAAGKTLYTVNLETGAATEVGAITGVDNDVRDIAILPTM